MITRKEVDRVSNETMNPINSVSDKLLVAVLIDIRESIDAQTEMQNRIVDQLGKLGWLESITNAVMDLTEAQKRATGDDT